MARQETTQSGAELQTREKQAVAREGTRPGPVFQPDVDILERKDEFVVFADLPGVDERHVDVRLERGVLAIDASLALQPEPSWTPLHAEYRVGGYHREFQLSEAVDTERIEAKMQEGVLELHLPKRDRHRTRQIEVRTG
jgi:HSP20 family molecular chaperone IbpA